MPGQYYDAETGKHYNYFRDFDPSLGRYVESDPIGLVAGMNTFTYVLASPLELIDAEGLRGGPGIPGWGGRATTLTCDIPCRHRWTITSRGPCSGQGPACATAMAAAGISGPAYGGTVSYDYACLLTLGLFGKGAVATVGNMAAKQAPNVVRKLGLGARAVGAAEWGAAAWTNPGFGAAMAAAAAPEVFRKCECSE